MPSLRERQAQLTRDEILSAARRLFAENGYSRTSVRDIAEAAGVSAQTVYDSIGSKQAIVARLNDLIDAEADIRPSSAPPPARMTRGRSRRRSARVRVDPGALWRHPPRPRHRRRGRTRPGAVLAEGHRATSGARDGSSAACSELDALDPIGRRRGRRRHTRRHLRRPLRPAAADSYGWSLDRIEGWIAATAARCCSVSRAEAGGAAPRRGSSSRLASRGGAPR